MKELIGHTYTPALIRVHLLVMIPIAKLFANKDYVSYWEIVFYKKIISLYMKIIKYGYNNIFLFVEDRYSQVG
jgi:hypothetical protein